MTHPSQRPIVRYLTITLMFVVSGGWGGDVHVHTGPVHARLRGETTTPRLI